MRLTRSQTKPPETKPIPIINVVEKKITKNIFRKKNPKSKHIILLKNAKRSIEKLKPSYNNKYTLNRANNVFNYLDKCENIINSSPIELDSELINQIKNLQTFKIFKDLDRVDIKSIHLLQSEIGELNENDLKLQEILNESSTTNDKKFYEFYGIEYEE